MYEQMTPSFASREKDSGNAITSGVKGSTQSAAVRRRKWYQSLPEERRNEIRKKDRLRKRLERARNIGNSNGHVHDTTTLPQDGPSSDTEMDTDLHDEESEIPVTDPITSRQHHVSKLVRFDSDGHDTEHDELAFAPETESCYIGSTHVPMDCTYADDKDLTIGVIGQKVPAQSGTIRWQDGRITILPTIMKKGVNICEYGDDEVVKFFASFPESTPSSKFVLHLSSADMERDDIVETIECSLRDNKPIVIRGNRRNTPKEITTEWLDRKFGISPDMPVSIHGEYFKNLQ